MVRALVAKYWATPFLRQLFTGAAWSVFGSAFSRLLTFASTVAIARILGFRNFGQLVILQSTLGLFGVFAGLGLGVVATKFGAELRSRDPVRLGRILNLVHRAAIGGGIAITVALMLCSHVIAARVIHLPPLAPLIAVASASVLFMTLAEYNNCVLLGFEAVRQSVMGTLVAGLFAIPVSLTLTFLYGLPGAVCGIVTGAALQWAASHWVLNRTLKNADIHYRSPCLGEWRVLKDYALPALLGGAMIAPAHWIVQVFLVNTAKGVVEIGVLGIGLQWLQAIYFFPLAFGRIVLPVMVNVASEGRSRHTSVILKSSVLGNAVVVIPLMLGVWILSHWITRLYGAREPHAAMALSVMVAAAALSAICYPVGQVLVAKGKIWYGWVMNLGWALLYIGVSRALIGYGALGVAVGLLTAYAVHTAWTFAWVWKDSTRATAAQA